ncbi:hypothetical protein COOONC_00918 [Cooperia oncophora]
MRNSLSILAALTVASSSALPSATDVGSITTLRAKRQCSMGRCGTTPICNICPVCCSDSPQMIMEVPQQRSCCASPRPSPSCCQAPPPPPPPPPVVSTVQCCRAAPVPVNPCCQALIPAPAPPPADQEQCCLAAPSPNNICCREMAPMPAPPPCRCGARPSEMECPGCMSYKPRQFFICPPMSISCRLAFRARRDAYPSLLPRLDSHSL